VTKNVEEKVDHENRSIDRCGMHNKVMHYIVHDADWYIIFFVIIFAQLEDTSLSVYLLRICK